MKVLTVVAIAVAIIGVQGGFTDKVELMKVHGECKVKTPTDSEIEEKALKCELVDDPNLKKQLVCSARKLKVLDSEDHINKENMKEVAHDMGIHISDEDVEKCAIEKETPEETMFESSQCICQHKEMDKHQH